MNELNEVTDSHKILESPILSPEIKNYSLDIDGTICGNILNEESWRIKNTNAYSNELKTINKWFDSEHIRYFLSNRTEEHREIIKSWLKNHKFKYHGIIFGKTRGRNYHWIVDYIVRATKFNGKFTDLIRKNRQLQIFIH